MKVKFTIVVNTFELIWGDKREKELATKAADRMGIVSRFRKRVG